MPQKANHHGQGSAEAKVVPSLNHCMGSTGSQGKFFHETWYFITGGKGIRMNQDLKGYLKKKKLRLGHWYCLRPPLLRLPYALDV